jgi:superoxide oxidase
MSRKTVPDWLIKVADRFYLPPYHRMHARGVATVERTRNLMGERYGVFLLVFTPRLFLSSVFCFLSSISIHSTHGFLSMNTTPSRSNIRQRYDRLSRCLHWIIAVGIIWTSVTGYMLHMIKTPKIWSFFSQFNQSVGSIIALLMVIRFCWRFFRPGVPYPTQISRRQQGFAMLMHELFYLIIFIVLISGFLMLKQDFQLFGVIHITQPIKNAEVNQFFFDVHRVGCIALLGMVMLHLIALIKHDYLQKLNIMSRML